MQGRPPARQGPVNPDRGPPATPGMPGATGGAKRRGQEDLRTPWASQRATGGARLRRTAVLRHRRLTLPAICAARSAPAPNLCGSRNIDVVRRHRSSGTVRSRCRSYACSSRMTFGVRASRKCAFQPGAYRLGACSNFSNTSAAVRELGSRPALHASSRRWVARTPLRFACHAAARSCADAHPRARARAGCPRRDGGPRLRPADAGACPQKL